MSSDADAHKVGLIPVTLMVSGNIMGSGVFLLPANLASTGGIAIYGWLVTIIGALGLSMVYAKMSFLDPVLVVLNAYARRCFGPFLGYQTNVLYWLACWIGKYRHGGHWRRIFKLLLPDSERSIGINHHLRRGAVDLRPAEHCRSEIITCVQAVATVLALIPIVGIAVFGWFWFRGETYMAAWNVSGLGTFGAIQSTLNVTLWSFIGGKCLRCRRCGEKPETQCPYRHHWWGSIAAVCYVLSTTAIMGMIPNAALRVSASPFGDAARMALGDTAGAIVSFCAAAGCLGSLGGWTLLAGQTAKAAADDGLFPLIFARVNKAGTPVAGLIIVGILMTIFQLSSISPNATKEFGLVSSVSVIFTLVPYLYTCAALLLLGHGHFGKARPAYLAVTTIAFLYCIWAVVGSGAKEVMWSFVTLMVITAMYALNYNRLI
ncbi:amino acid permease [Escherichia coli]